MIIILSLYNLSLVSQSCYTVIGDYNGFQNPSIISELNTKSCELKDAMPSRFRNDFGVFDFGFYPLNENMAEGFDGFWQEAQKLAIASKSYYLLIGREASINGIYNKIHIDLKFPKSHELDCVTDEQISYLRFQIEKNVNSIKNKSLLELETKAIEIFKDFVETKIICCDQGNRTQCGNCLDVEDFTEYLSDNNFNSTNVQTLTKTNLNVISENVKEFAQLNFTLDGTQVDVNQDVKDLVAELKEFSDNVLAEIQYYSVDSCSKSFDMVESNPFKGSATPYFYIKVIGTNSILGDKISVKLESNLYKGKGSGTLFVLNLNGENETSKIITHTQYFFDLAGLNIKLKPIKKLETIGDYDGIVVIGNNKTKVAKFVLGNLMSMLDTHEPCSTEQHDKESFYNKWYLKPTKDNPEISSRKTILISTENFSYVKYKWNDTKNSNKLEGSDGSSRLIGFIILHGTSHNAGFKHDYYGDDETGLGYDINGKGYADHGHVITDYLNNYQTLFSFEKIIEHTKDLYGHIIVQTNVRYGN